MDSLARILVLMVVGSIIGWTLAVPTTGFLNNGKNVPSGLSKRVLSQFTRLAHGLRSGNVTVMNERAFFIPDLYYDGQGPDAFFFIGSGSIPVNGRPLTTAVKIPDENQSYGVLKKYSGQSILLKVPSHLNLKNYDWLAMWCVKYAHLFGYVKIPKTRFLPRAGIRLNQRP